MNDLPHLTLEAREDSQLPDAERVLRIRAERWVHYHLAETALVRMSELLAYPQRDRMPCCWMEQRAWARRRSYESSCATIPQLSISVLASHPLAPSRCRCHPTLTKSRL
jgi:Bacterial TniB protein